MIIEGAGLASGQVVGVKLAANRHVPAAVDQPMIVVIQRLGADIHPFAPGQRGSGAVFRQVVKGDGLHANSIAINTAGANVGQRIGLDQRMFAVNQTIVVQGTVDRQPVLPGVYLAAGGIEQIIGAQIELGTRQQFAAVGHIARRGEIEIAVGNHLTAVIDALCADQVHIAQRQQLPVAADRCCVDVQQLARFNDTAGVQQVKRRALQPQVFAGGQLASAVIQLTAVGDSQLLVSQNAAAPVAQRAGVQRHGLAFQPFIFRLGVVVDELQGIERHGGAAADQPQGVVDNPLRAVQQQVADRLNLSVAVIQTGAGELNRLFANNPPAVTVVQFQRRQGKVTFGPQRSALIIDVATAELQFTQAVQGTVLVIQQLVVGIDMHIRTRLHQSTLVIQAACAGGIQHQCLLCYQFAATVQQRFGIELQALAGNHHALAVIEYTGSEVHRPLAGDAALVAAVGVGQPLNAQI
ncbi:hypothetical protein D3C80_468260 [compost metagenome]